MRNLVIALLILIATAVVALAAQPAFAGSESAAEPRMEPVGDGLWQARQLLRLAPSRL